MSFSAEVKRELCQIEPAHSCCVAAEVYGALLHAAGFSDKGVRMTSTLPEVLARQKNLLQRAFGVEATLDCTHRLGQLTVTEPHALARLHRALGYDDKPYVSYHLNRNMVEEPCCWAAFVRGAFLMAGTVAGPDKKSHFEVKTMRYTLPAELTSVLLDLGIAPKQARRAGSQLLYLKNGASIVRLLGLMGAEHAAEQLQQSKREKRLRSHVNRQVNCEAANVLRATNTAAQQICSIRAYLTQKGEDAFPEALRETVALRLRYPQDSLSELAARFAPPLSKAGVSHRIRKIMQIAAEEGER